MSADTTLTLTRILKAPRALVWKCLSTPEHLQQFWVPHPHTIPRIIMDVRPGGQFFTEMNVDGNLYPSEGSFLAVTPGEMMVFTDMFTADWQPVAEPGLGFTGQLILSDVPGGTEYRAVARHRTKESADSHAAMGFEGGWGTVAQQLEDYVRAKLI